MRSQQNTPAPCAPHPAQHSSAPLPTWRLACRFVGYVAFGVFCATLWLIVVAALVLFPFGLAMGGQPLTEMPGIQEIASDPIQLAVTVLLMPVMAQVFGYAILLAPWRVAPPAILSFTFAARSLRREFAHEELSGIVGPRGRWPNPPYPDELPLIPVRHSRFTDLVLKAYGLGNLPSVRMALMSAPFGAAYLFAIGCALWPVTDRRLIALAAVLTLALAGWSLVSVLAAARRHLTTPGIDLSLL